MNMGIFGELSTEHSSMIGIENILTIFNYLRVENSNK
jgi:hypothetical protein